MTSIATVAEVTSGIYAQKNKDGNTLFLQPSDFQMDERSSEERTKTIIHLRSSQRKHLLQADDVLLVSKGHAHTCFHVSSLTQEAVASTAFFVIRLHQESGILPEYLCWYLNLPVTQSRLSAIAKGTSLPSLSIQDVGRFLIHLPSFTYQNAIIKLAAMHQRKKELEATLARHTDTLFQHQLLNLAKQSA